ncbi:MAG: NPCBM/NEW2 domain-containing protein [Bacillota bacterium]|nr:NPCBM/NEW2 domain-containing protein [Bacillota bacterium]
MKKKRYIIILIIALCFEGCSSSVANNTNHSQSKKSNISNQEIKPTQLPSPTISPFKSTSSSNETQHPDMRIGSTYLPLLNFILGAKYTSTGMWDDGRNYKEQSVKLSAKEYKCGIGCCMISNFTNEHISYNIGSSYKKLTGYFGISDETDTTNKEKVQLKILGDGNELYTSPKIKLGDKPLKVEVDLKGVQLLKIEFIRQADKNAVFPVIPVLAEPKLE